MAPKSNLATIEDLTNLTKAKKGQFLLDGYWTGLLLA